MDATTRRGGRLSGIVPMVVVGIIVVLFARSCMQGFSIGGSDDDREPDGSDPMGVLDDPDEEDDKEEAEPPDPDSPEGAELLTPRDPECPDETGNERHLQWTEPPPMCINPENNYTATLETSRGNIVIELDTDNAPETVNNFVFLARWGFYDDMAVHAVIPGDSASTGDPIGDPPGTGGPGYTFDDEFLPENEDPPYPVYSVAMGNAGPDTNSSVFFMMTGAEAESLPVYSRFGQITDEESQGVVDAIDATGVREVGGDGTPRQGQETTIETVTITEE